MARIIDEEFLAHICPYRRHRYKQDSHVEIETYCSFPPQDYGHEPECKYQCTQEVKEAEDDGGQRRMELDEAIKHCEDKAKELRKEKHIMAVIGREQEWADCLQCAEEHEQLAEWLTDYKRLKTLAGEWKQDINGWHVCSNCHMKYQGMPTIDRKPRWRYCPTCGAKMMKEAERE